PPGAGVTVGTRPQLPAGPVVQDKAAAHARAADREHGTRVGERTEDLLDAGADESPIPRRGEVLRAVDAGYGRMGPFPLGEAHLPPRQIEKHRAAAPGTGI